jgi:hypothetical protein
MCLSLQGRVCYAIWWDVLDTIYRTPLDLFVAWTMPGSLRRRCVIRNVDVQKKWKLRNSVSLFTELQTSGDRTSSICWARKRRCPFLTWWRRQTLVSETSCVFFFNEDRRWVMSKKFVISTDSCHPRWLSYLSLGPRFVCSYTAEDSEFLSVITIRSKISFGEVKLAVSCRKISRHVNDPYSMKEILAGKIHGHLSKSFSCFATRCLSSCYGQRALVGEWGVIRTQVGKHNRSVMVAVYGTPCAIPPHTQ